MGTVFRANMRTHAANIDDATAVFSHCRQAGVHAAEGAVEDDVHDLTPLGKAHFRYMLFAPQSRVVYKNIDAAEFLERSIGKRFGGLVIPDITKNRNRLATGRLYLPYDTVGFALGRSYVDDHRRTGICEHQCDRTADIAPSAGNHSDLTGEFFFTHRFLHSSCQAQVRGRQKATRAGTPDRLCLHKIAPTA